MNDITQGYGSHLLRVKRNPYASIFGAARGILSRRTVEMRSTGLAAIGSVDADVDVVLMLFACIAHVWRALHSLPA